MMCWKAGAAIPFPAGSRWLPSRPGHLLLLAAVSLGLGSTVRAQEVTRLRCEAREKPLGIEATVPRLSWELKSAGRGLLQGAYRVLVATRPDLLEPGRADLWDSGRVESSRSWFVPYGGRTLRSWQRCFWTVRIWDGEGHAAPWSAPSEWTMGLLGSSEWTGRWIERPAAPGPEPTAATDSRPLPLFRREFDLDRPARRALVAICGLGHHELRINGARVGDGVLVPGWTDYRDTCLYLLHDVTSLLRVGENALGVLLGNGMYNVTGGRYTKFTGSFGAPTVILELRVEHDDGSTTTISSDGCWKTTAGPILFSCVYGGEDHDARREPPGWDRPGFDDSNWSAAVAGDGPGGILRAQEAPATVVIDTIRPAKVTGHGPGQYIVDLGDNFAGRPVLRTRGPAGGSIRITPSERVDGFRAVGNFGHSYRYWLRGEGEETWRPRFTYYGFRYLLVEGAALPGDADGSLPVLLEIFAEYLHSASPRVGGFASSDELLNRIHSMIDWSVGSNLQSVLTDCPHREKLGWLEVAHLMGPSILYHYDAFGLLRKIARDTADSQLASGLVPDIAPEYTRFQGGFFESAEWGSASVQLPWLLYLWYGDREILERQYETMCRYTRYLESTRDDRGLARPGLGDWYDWPPETGHRGRSQLTPPELTATAMLHSNARVLAEVSDLLGHEAEARRFRSLAEAVRESYNRAYLDPETGIYATGSQAAQAVSLHHGLVPDEHREAALRRVVDELERTGYRQTTGEVAFRSLVQTLANAGRHELIFDMIHRTDAPGYGCLLAQGLTTLSERWDRPGSSLNHCMFGHIQEWFQAHLVGIRQSPGSRAFRRVVIAPRPVGDLTWVRGHLDSPHGRLSVSWRKRRGRFDLELTVPGNTIARVELPARSPGRVTESQRPVGMAPGVSFLGQVGGRSRFEVGSGHYRFSAPQD